MARSGHGRLAGIVGMAGIGKTALIRGFLASACPPAVLWASGDEDEAVLPWGFLDQLVRGAPRAFQGRLGRLVGDLHPDADPLFVGAGLLSALGEGVDQGGLVVVLDDAHWADPRSLTALRFALRRLVHEPMLTVVAFRPRGSGPGEAWCRLLDGERGTTIQLAGLSPGDLVRLAEAVRHLSLSARGAQRLFDHTGGHPLWCHTLLQEISPRVFEKAEDPLPAPPDLASAVAARYRACSSATQALVGAAAVLGSRCALATAVLVAGDQASPQASSSLSGAAGSVAEAVDAGLLAGVAGSRGGEVGFPHPLVRAAIYQDLDPLSRLGLHARAASAVGGAAALAHRVAGAAGADSDLADDLERASQEGQRARRPDGTAYLSEALRLSPPGPARNRRLLGLVEALLVAGDVVGAADHHAELRELPSDPWCDYVAGYLDLVSARVGEARARLSSAWAALASPEKSVSPGAPPDLAARVASQLAILAVVGLDQSEMLRWGDAAVSAGAAEGWVGAFAWLARSLGLGLAGRAREALADLAELDRPGGPGGLDGLVARGILALWTDEPLVAHEDLAQAMSRAAGGEPLRVRQALGYAAEAAYRLGRLGQSVEYAELAVADATEAGRVWDLPILHAQACYPRAARGEWREAEAHAQGASEWAGLIQTGAALTYAASARAALARARGDGAGYLAAAVDLDAAYRLPEPGPHGQGPALAEALAWADRLDEAEAALDSFGARSVVAGRCSAEVAVARVRGEVAARRGHWAAAAAAFEDALAGARSLPEPLQRAHVHAAYGGAAQRHGHRRLARLHLGAARAGYRTMGAWAYAGLLAEAPGDLTGEPAGSDGAALTPTEAAVARLVAGRLTNREVAARLLVGVKTVEYHLTNVYAKLDVSSRRQLADRLEPCARQAPPPQGRPGDI